MTTTTRKAHGVRTIRVSECSKLIVVVESGSVPNIEFQFGAAPEAAPAPAPAETMKVEAHAPAPEAAPAPAKKHGFRRKAKSAPANNAPAPAPTNAAPAAPADAPKGKGKGKSFKGKDNDKPAPLCSAQRLCEYLGKTSGKWHTFAVVGSGEVKKENGTWPKGTRFVQLRYIKVSEDGSAMITGQPFAVQESDWQTNLRNVRRYEPTETLWCGCDLCCE